MLRNFPEWNHFAIQNMALKDTELYIALKRKGYVFNLLAELPHFDDTIAPKRILSYPKEVIDWYDSKKQTRPGM